MKRSEIEFVRVRGHVLARQVGVGPPPAQKGRDVGAAINHQQLLFQVQTTPTDNEGHQISKARTLCSRRMYTLLFVMTWARGQS